MNQKAMRRKPMDEWLSVQGSALRNPVWAEAPSVSSGSASLFYNELTTGIFSYNGDIATEKRNVRFVILSLTKDDIAITI